jgi:hypothetical protein
MKTTTGWGSLPQEIGLLIFREMSFLDSVKSKKDWEDVVSWLLVCSKSHPALYSAMLELRFDFRIPPFAYSDISPFLHNIVVSSCGIVFFSCGMPPSIWPAFSWTVCMTILTQKLLRVVV